MTTHPLHLTRPLAIPDLETTGTDTAKDRIVEIAVVRLNCDGTVDRRPTEGRRLINPGIPIPAEATAVHGITDADVADAPPFSRIARGLLGFIEGCDLGGFNVVGFDLIMLWTEFNRCGVDWSPDMARVVDAGAIFKHLERRRLVDAVRMYLGRPHKGAHGAVADALATAEVLVAQATDTRAMEWNPDEPDRYQRFVTGGIEDMFLATRYDRPTTPVDVAGKLYRDEEGDVCFAFGKDAGTKVKANPGLARWMLDPSRDFCGDTKRCIREELAR